MLTRVDQAWRARVAGASWRQAATIAGYTDENNCARAVKRVYGKLPTPEREDLRRLWRDRLEVTWRQAITDLLEQRPGAITHAVRVQTAAARLDGLDEPSRVELYTPTQREIERFVGTLLAQAHPELEEGDIFEGEVVSDEPDEAP